MRFDVSEVQYCKETKVRVNLYFWSKCVQYIQNTINKVEVKYIKNNYKGIDVEGHRRVVIDMPKGVCMHRHHIWKVGTSLIRWPSGCEVILIKASWNNWITGWKWFRMVWSHMEWSQKACRIIWMGLVNESGAPQSQLFVCQCVVMPLRFFFFMFPRRNENSCNKFHIYLFIYSHNLFIFSMQSGAQIVVNDTYSS